jgi:hypothetical protein
MLLCVIGRIGRAAAGRQAAFALHAAKKALAFLRPTQVDSGIHHYVRQARAVVRGSRP